MKKVRALVLLSGGLDSMLAAKILEEQAVAVTGIVFVSNFYQAERAKQAAAQINIPLKVVDISREMLELVKNPPSGHGKNLNPCLDCHALMVRKTAEIAEKEGFDIIATGETLGQRPFSQNKQSLSRVIKLSGVDILRPLSAKLLRPTKYEQAGLVDRERLFDISGRGRERQIKMARKFGIKEYPMPSGGCMLTVSGWSEKLGKMLANWPDCDINDVELLKSGRAFWVRTRTWADLGGILTMARKNKWVLIIVGRSKEDNEQLEKLTRKNDIILELKDEVGPKTVMRITNQKLRVRNYESRIKIPAKLDIDKLNLDKPISKKEILEMATLLTGWHAVKARGRNVTIQFYIN